MRLSHVWLATIAASSVVPLPITLLNYSEQRVKLAKRGTEIGTKIFGKFLVPNQPDEDTSLARLSDDLKLNKVNVEFNDAEPELRLSPQRALGSTAESTYTAPVEGSKRKTTVATEGGASASGQPTTGNKRIHLSDDAVSSDQAMTHQGSSSNSDKHSLIAQPSEPASRATSSSRTWETPEHSTRVPGATFEPRQHALTDAEHRDVASMSTQEVQDEFDKLSMRYFRERSSASSEEGRKIFSRLDALDAALQKASKLAASKPVASEDLHARFLPIMKFEHELRRAENLRERSKDARILPNTSTLSKEATPQVAGPSAAHILDSVRLKETDRARASPNAPRTTTHGDGADTSTAAGPLQAGPPIIHSPLPSGGPQSPYSVPRRARVSATVRQLLDYDPSMISRGDLQHTIDVLKAQLHKWRPSVREEPIGGEILEKIRILRKFRARLPRVEEVQRPQR